MLTPAQSRRPALRSQRGQSIVEFVLVLPFMLVLLFGIIDFGVAVNHSSDLNQVAADTARRLAVNTSSTLNPETLVRSSVEPKMLLPPNSAFAVDVSLPGGTIPGSDHAVCVKVTMRRDIVVIPGFGLGPTLNLSGKAAMRLEMPANFVGASTATGKTSACS